MIEKVPPHNLEAEKSVLGGLMLESSAFDIVSELIGVEDFYRSHHRIIFQAILDLQKKSEEVDLLTVSHILNSRNELEKIGGAAYLAELAEATIGASNIERYAEIVKETALLRKLIQTSSDTIEKAYSGDFESVETFIDQAEANIFRLAENRKTTGLASSAEIVKTAIQKIEDLYHKQSEVTGVSTGFTDLNKITSGFQPGELTILAARPSMGKTAFSLNLAQHIALRENKTIAYFSVEMGKESLMMRMLASEAFIDMQKLRVGRVGDEVWPKLIATASHLTNSKLYIDDTSGISPYEVRAKCRRLKAKHGLDMIVIDYLQLMDLKRPVESRERAVSEISKTLKEIAKELQVPVMALAQLNRGVESRTDRRPMLSDLRESGSIEQDADLIMMIYRDEYYEKEKSEYKGQAEIIIAKQRNGPTGTVRLGFRQEFGRFHDLVPDSLERSAPPVKQQEAPEEKKSRGPVKNFAPGVDL